MYRIFSGEKPSRKCPQNKREGKPSENQKGQQPPPAAVHKPLVIFFRRLWVGGYKFVDSRRQHYTPRQSSPAGMTRKYDVANPGDDTFPSPDSATAEIPRSLAEMPTSAYDL